MYLIQIWFNLSDEGIEDSIYDNHAMRSFMHIDFNEQQVPDATTLLKFRHMLEASKLGEKIFADVNNRLDKAGLMMHDVIETANLIKEDDEKNPQSGVNLSIRFLIVKKQMGYSKVVYRGIAKNMYRFHILFASANLLICSRAGRTKDFIVCTV